MKVLWVDDDRDLLAVVSFALRRDGYDVIEAADGPSALKRWQADRPDIVILDIGLPGMNGFEVCKRIRAEAATPIMLLSGLTSENNIARGLRLGADDYVTKPFSPRILSLRIEALLRRHTITSQRHTPGHVNVGMFSLDTEAHEVCHFGRRIQLTAIEFRLFHLLASNAGRVVPSARLIEYAWGLDGGDVSLLKTNISRIRGKLGLSANGQDGIAALPRVGYRLSANPTSHAG